jgi:AraC-like DNA-binding protein
MVERPDEVLDRPTLREVDALASLLDGPRGRGAFLFRTVLEPPWSVRMDDGAPLGLLAVVQGSAWVVPDDGAPQLLRAGAVAVIKGPSPVTLSSDVGLPPDVVCGPGGRRTNPAGVDVGGALSFGRYTWGNNPHGSTRLLMGCYQLRGEVSQRVLDALPPSMVVEPEIWRSALVPLLEDEIELDAPGQRPVLDRLFDLLLVSVLRGWFNRPGATAPGWYRAHTDPVVGHALRLLQEDPARPWTVARLAAEAGASRSALARAFTDLVGTPPMAFLKEWRLAHAADLLLDADLTVDAIARRVGYSDGSALSAVFKKARGISPQQHRETAQRLSQA